MSQGKEQDFEEFRRLLSKTTPEDFDGHTEFHQLIPEQKLDWLAEGARFIIEMRRSDRKRGLGSEPDVLRYECPPSPRKNEDVVG